VGKDHHGQGSGIGPGRSGEVSVDGHAVAGLVFDGLDLGEFVFLQVGTIA